MAAIKNKIYIRSKTDPDFYFENDSIDSANVVQKVALVGKELSVDTFTPVVIDDQNELHDVYHFLSSDGHEIMDSVGQIYAIDVGAGTNVSPLITLENGTPVWYYQDDTLIGKFYVKGVERVGADKYRLDTVSAIGMLDEMQHGGGLFVASTFGEVLAHILAKDPHGTGDPVIDYEIDEDVEELPVTGWLPYDTKRNNLYQLIFANGINIVKNIDGNPRFTFLYPAPEDSELIETEQIYDQGSVSYEKPYTNVVVMEHTWTPITTEEPVVLFDNTVGTAADHTEIKFDNAPIIVSTLTVSGSLAIDVDADQNPLVSENHAIVTGNGKLTGIPYLHDTRAVNLGDSSASDEKTIKVTDATFVNLINSDNLLLRLYAFYCPNNYIHKISNGIVYSDFTTKEIVNGAVVDKHYTGGQRCGKVYRLSDPYGKEETAFLSSMDITASGVNKAECEWYADYVPAGLAGLYQHVDILIPYYDEEDPETLLYEGDWEVPANVTKFRVVIIGGGTGGGSGWPGANGQDSNCYTEVAETDDLSGVWYGAEGGDGGDGGAGGDPGRVKVVTVENAVPGTTYHWEVGQGGDGGAATGFIPDTFDELKSMLQSTMPDITYTDAQITEMVADEQSLSGWSGSPNAGSAGTASTFGIEGGAVWSSADPDGYVPTGGVYEPIYDDYYALIGNGGIKGGKGGARQVKSGGTFNWVTDGEDVVGDNGETYRGGSTGVMLTTVSGLPEASIKAYGGNGAGAAVGIDRNTHSHINGSSDQWTTWDVTQDEDWEPPTPTPTPAPEPEPEPEPGPDPGPDPGPEPEPVYPAITATLSTTSEVEWEFDPITWSIEATGGNGEYSYYFNIYCDNEVVKYFDWQPESSVTWKTKVAGIYHVEGYVKDSRNTETVLATGSGTVEVTPIVPEDESFGGCSDGWFVDYIQSARNGTVDLQQDLGWAVGDRREISVGKWVDGIGNTHQPETLVIVLSSFEEYNGCGNVIQFDFQREPNLGTTLCAKNGETYDGGYGASPVYTQALPSFANALPQYLKGLLLTFDVVTQIATSASTYEPYIVTDNKLALRALSEVFSQEELNSSEFWDGEVDGYRYEGDQVDFYKTAANRIKERNKSSDTGWWSRTMGLYMDTTSTEGSYITQYGKARLSFAFAYKGIAPFGCI